MAIWVPITCLTINNHCEIKNYQNTIVFWTCLFQFTIVFVTFTELIQILCINNLRIIWHNGNSVYLNEIKVWKRGTRACLEVWFRKFEFEACETKKSDLMDRLLLIQIWVMHINKPSICGKFPYYFHALQWNSKAS